MELLLFWLYGSILSFVDSKFFNKAVASLWNLITELCFKCCEAQKDVTDTRVSCPYS